MHTVLHTVWVDTDGPAGRSYARWTGLTDPHARTWHELGLQTALADAQQRRDFKAAFP
jgi:hypothetical protein